MDNKRPAPLSADSLREQWFDILEKAGFNENERLIIERLTKPYIAAALQSEHRRIADSLPEKRRDSQINSNGWNEALEAVRAVLIPPTPEDKTINATFYKTELDAGLGGLDKPSEPAEPKGTKSITGASASEEER